MRNAASSVFFTVGTLLSFAACGKDEAPPTRAPSSTVVVIASEDRFYFAAPTRFAKCFFGTEDNEPALRCDVSLPYSGGGCIPQRSLSFSLRPRGGAGYACVVESDLGDEGQQVRELPSGTTLEAGPFVCVSRRGPVLRCKNRSGNGFQLRPGADKPDARTVF